MFPYIKISDYSIPMYSILSLAGVFLAVLYYLSSRRKSNFPEADGELVILYSLIGAFLGAKLLFLLTVLPELIEEIPFLFSQTERFLEKYLYSGFVFFGGLYGILLASYLYCRICRLDFSECIRLLFPMIPLAHAFGRLGCFCMGCCYGHRVSFGIEFSDSPVAPNNIPLLPVQLIEAAAELALFVLSAFMARRGSSGYRILGAWLISYGMLRFILEFFRGDDYRGFLGILSISQIISAFTILLGIWIIVRSFSHHNSSAPQKMSDDNNCEK